MKLNLGCCDLPLAGYVNIDYSTSPHIKADLVADVLNLSDHFAPESVDEIWFAHGIEHLRPDQIDDAVDHWRSLLKPGGTLGLVTPDFRALVQHYLAGDISLEKMNHEFLYSYVQEDLHKSMHDQASHFQLLSRHGFTDITPIDRMGDARLHYKDSLQVGAEGKKA